MVSDPWTQLNLDSEGRAFDGTFTPGGGYKEMSSIVADQPIAPSYTSPNAGGRGVGVAGVPANEYSCAHHVTWSPNKLWRSNSIFNL